MHLLYSIQEAFLTGQAFSWASPRDQAWCGHTSGLQNYSRCQGHEVCVDCQIRRHEYVINLASIGGPVLPEKVQVPLKVEPVRRGHSRRACGQTDHPLRRFASLEMASADPSFTLAPPLPLCCCTLLMSHQRLIQMAMNREC